MSRRGLLPGTAVTEDGTPAVAPPPMTIEPGLPPGSISRLAGTGPPVPLGAVTEAEYGRTHPKVVELTTVGETTCVSCMPNVRSEEHREGKVYSYMKCKKLKLKYHEIESELLTYTI